MSIRRRAGDILFKIAGAGFTGASFKVKIPTLEDFQKHGFGYTNLEQDYDACLMDCGDEECREYANLIEINEDGSEGGWVCHVSECQLEDIK